MRLNLLLLLLDKCHHIDKVYQVWVRVWPDSLVAVQILPSFFSLWTWIGMKRPLGFHPLQFPLLCEMLMTDETHLHVMHVVLTGARCWEGLCSRPWCKLWQFWENIQTWGEAWRSCIALPHEISEFFLYEWASFKTRRNGLLNWCLLWKDFLFTWHGSQTADYFVPCNLDLERVKLYRNSQVQMMDLKKLWDI